MLSYCIAYDLSVMHCIKAWCLVFTFQAALVQRLTFSFPLDVRSDPTVTGDMQEAFRYIVLHLWTPVLQIVGGK